MKYHYCKICTEVINYYPMNIQKVFQNMRGIWRLQRHLEDKTHPTLSGSVQGQAKFIISQINPHALSYVEQGEFVTQASHRYSINREYIYVYNHNDNTIKKYHAENNKKLNLFYTLHFDFSAPNNHVQAFAEHQCNQDLYHAIYNFYEGSDFIKFNLTYVVTGPKKNYISNPHSRDLAANFLYYPL